MLGVLLESKARRQRRTAGATLSVVLHIAVIGAAVARTAHGTTAPPTPPRVVTVHLSPPKPRDVHRDTRATSRVSTPTAPTDVVIRHIDPPGVIPVELPPIDMSHGLGGDSIEIGGAAGARVGTLGALYGDQLAKESRDWDVREVLMHVVTQTVPRYPESLRSAGIDGHVLVQFTIDTTGRVEMTHVVVLQSTHELFTRAVRDALAGFRFLPAQVDGRRVSALAQMPFEFHITR